MCGHWLPTERGKCVTGCDGVKTILTLLPIFSPLLWLLGKDNIILVPTLHTIVYILIHSPPATEHGVVESINNAPSLATVCEPRSLCEYRTQGSHPRSPLSCTNMIHCTMSRELSPVVWLSLLSSMLRCCNVVMPGSLRTSFLMFGGFWSIQGQISLFQLRNDQ